MQTSTTLKSLAIIFLGSVLFSQANAQNPGCTASWSSSNGNAPSQCTVTFTDLSTGTGTGTQYSWNFGDGQVAATQNPSNTYTASGSYSVCLTIIVPSTTGSVCTNTYCRIIYVQCGNGTTNGVTDLFNERSVSVYPNPSNGMFEIMNKQSTIENLEMSVYNMLGEKVYSGVLKQQTSTFDFSSQLNGVYIIQVSAPDKESFTQKLIIQK